MDRIDAVGEFPIAYLIDLARSAYGSVDCEFANSIWMGFSIPEQWQLKVQEGLYSHVLQRSDSE